MFLWLALATFGVGIILMLLLADKGDFLEVGLFMTIVGAIGSFILVMMILINRVGLDADIKKLQIRHDTIMYQCENEVYKEDIIGKRGLIEDVMEWNQEVTWNKEMRKNPWFGILHTTAYDNFDAIDLEGLLDNQGGGN